MGGVVEGAPPVGEELRARRWEGTRKFRRVGVRRRRPHEASSLRPRGDHPEPQLAQAALSASVCGQSNFDSYILGTHPQASTCQKKYLVRLSAQRRASTDARAGVCVCQAEVRTEQASG